jgi:hypothetical protein
MRIKNWSLKEFARHALVYWPQACKDHKLPTRGCMPAVKAWLEATGIGIPGFVDKVKTATGNRAMALYWCATLGWIPRAEAVELIKTAPGNQPWALYRCAILGWIPGDQAVELIKTADGNRAWALYRCAYQNWIPGQEAVELIKSAPGDRAWALYRCADRGWITKAEVKTYLETR